MIRAVIETGTKKKTVKYQKGRRVSVFMKKQLLLSHKRGKSFPKITVEEGLSRLGNEHVKGLSGK